MKHAFSRSRIWGKLNGGKWVSAAIAVAHLVSCGSDDDGSTGAAGAGGSGGGLPQCPGVCASIMAASCPNGPPSQSECTTLCEQFRTGTCAERFRALSDCGGGTPNFTCDAQGFVTVTGCETEYNALIACLAP